MVLYLQGYKYAGLQTSYCFCGNAGYDKYGENPRGCNAVCNGDAMSNCGGGWHNQVYETGKE